MEKISPYYAFFIKGSYQASSNSLGKVRLAVENLKKALEYKQTEEVYNLLSACYMKLDESDLYEQTIVQGAEGGCVSLYSSCGLFYANSPKKFKKEKALFWFQKGININDIKSISDLANLYITGCRAFKPNYDKAIDLYTQGLRLNDPKWNGYFSWAIGLAYYDKKDYDIAFEYYRRAVKYKYPQASYNLALLYRDGLGVQKDLDRYMDYLLMNLNANSALELAAVYFLGEHVPADLGIAFMYFDYAANQGNPTAALMCAGLLLEKENYNESAVNKYLESAFRNGAKDEKMKSEFDDIEKVLGEKVGKKLLELAEKYWNYREGKA